MSLSKSKTCVNKLLNDENNNHLGNLPKIYRKLPLKKQLTPYLLNQDQTLMKRSSLSPKEMDTDQLSHLSFRTVNSETSDNNSVSINYETQDSKSTLSTKSSKNLEHMENIMDRYYTDVGINFHEEDTCISQAQTSSSPSDLRIEYDTDSNRIKVKRTPSTAYIKSLTFDQREVLARSVTKNSKAKNIIRTIPEIKNPEMPPKLNKCATILNKSRSFDSNLMPKLFDLYSPENAEQISNKTKFANSSHQNHHHSSFSEKFSNLWISRSKKYKIFNRTSSENEMDDVNLVRNVSLKSKFTSDQLDDTFFKFTTDGSQLTLISPPGGLTTIDSLHSDDLKKSRPFILTDLLKILMDNNIDVQKDGTDLKNKQKKNKRKKEKYLKNLHNRNSENNMYFSESPEKSVFCTVLREAQNYCEDQPVVPLIFQSLIHLLEEYKEETGIYRISGSGPKIIKLQKMFNEIWLQKRANNQFWKENLTSYLEIWHKILNDQPEIRCHDIAGLIKRYLRAFKEPLLTNLYELLFLKINDISSNNSDSNNNLEAKLSALNLCFLLLPLSHQMLLLYFLKHLKTIAENCSSNKMTITNLAVCLGSCLFDESIMEDINFVDAANNVMFLLIKYQKILGVISPKIVLQTRWLNRMTFSEFGYFDQNNASNEIDLMPVNENNFKQLSAKSKLQNLFTSKFPKSRLLNRKESKSLESAKNIISLPHQNLTKNLSSHGEITEFSDNNFSSELLELQIAVKQHKNVSKINYSTYKLTISTSQDLKMTANDLIFYLTDFVQPEDRGLPTHESETNKNLDLTTLLRIREQMEIREIKEGLERTTNVYEIGGNLMIRNLNKEAALQDVKLLNENCRFLVVLDADNANLEYDRLLSQRLEIAT